MLKWIKENAGLLIFSGFVLVIGCIPYLISINKSTMEFDTKVRTYSEVSTAITERGELIIIDRKSGYYTIYSDSVSMGIFNLNASRLYNKINGKTNE